MSRDFLAMTVWIILFHNASFFTLKQPNLRLEIESVTSEADEQVRIYTVHICLGFCLLALQSHIYHRNFFNRVTGSVFC